MWLKINQKPFIQTFKFILNCSFWKIENKNIKFSTHKIASEKLNLFSADFLIFEYI